MEVYLNRIDGIDDALISLLMSKRSWTRDTEEHIRKIVGNCTDRNGFPTFNRNADEINEFNDKIKTLAKWGASHITLLSFIDLSVTVEGMHRAGQDDIDAHAKRYDNRIIRNSTRLAKFGNEKSDFYKGKILTFDDLCDYGIINPPDTISVDNKKYVKVTNGYVLEEYVDNKDVLRGLYPLSIPSSFVFKVNLKEWAHVYKERNTNGSANPEVKQFAEKLQEQIESKYPLFNRELMLKIKN